MSDGWNCKPNDLARVVKGTPKDNINRIIRVTEWSLIFGKKVWEYEGHLDCACGGHHRIYFVCDDCLKPLDNPGDEESDETLSWLPVPREKESA